MSGRVHTKQQPGGSIASASSSSASAASTLSAFGSRVARGFARTLPWRVRLASWRFVAQRSHYFLDLAVTLERDATGRTLLELFQSQAARSRAGSHRAVLAHWWARRYLMSGGDLARTFEGTLPITDVACLAMTQTAGQQAMTQMLRTMAERTRLLQRCRRDFLKTVWAGFAASLMAILVLMVLPLYTSEQLLQAFAGLTAEEYGPWTTRLLGWVHGVRHHAVWGAIACGMLAAGWGWARHRWSGPLRDRFDRLGMWRQMRDHEAMCFLSLTSTLVDTLGARGLSLRSIVQMQLELARPWLRRHLMRMLTSMELGADPLRAMDTGLLDRGVWGDLQASVRARGLTRGFAHGANQTLQQLMARTARNALVLRWVLLLGSVAIVLLMGYLHVRTFDELRQIMLLKFSVG